MKGQRVNIQYSVQIEELPTVLEKLIKQAETRMLQISNEFLRSDMSHSVVVHESYLHCAEQIDQMRYDLSDLDYRLQDCSNMMRGIAQMKSTPPAQAENRMDEIQEAIAQTGDLVEQLSTNDEEDQ
jgi:hypothetical protein